MIPAFTFPRQGIPFLPKARESRLLFALAIGVCSCARLASACGETVPPAQLLPSQQAIVDMMEKQRQSHVPGVDVAETISEVETYYRERDILVMMQLCGGVKKKPGRQKLYQARIEVASQLVGELSAHLTAVKDRTAAGSATSADVAKYETAVLRANLKLETLKLLAER